ncbi:MAG TPA: ABC transporter permease subunit [Trebonia sp.]|jgi:ABC-type nitrate/sulfonate/bicarbonate transport system permease component|nr:ABC transporter permease subunit [Trebonia sp.]
MAGAVRNNRSTLAEWSRTVLLPVGVAVVFGILWQIDAEHQKSSLVIPTVGQTFSALGHLLFSGGQLWKALGTSNEALVYAYLIAAVGGVTLGLAAARFRLLGRLMDPYLDMALAMPEAPLIPLALIAFGIGIVPRVLLIILFAITPIIINTRAGVRNVDPQVIEMARSYGASERQLWLRVLLPGAWPAIMLGLRLGLALAIDGMIIVELLMVSVGIGNLVMQYRATLEGGLLFATVICVALEALLLLSLMRLLERRLTKWAR